MDDFETRVDSYRQEHESIPEWAMRKEFMLSHYRNFDEDRLVCLANCYVNMEFYGASYPRQVMETVRELAKDLSEDIAASKASFAKRNTVEFVKSEHPAKEPQKKKIPAADLKYGKFVKAGSGDVDKKTENKPATASQSKPNSEAPKSKPNSEAPKSKPNSEAPKSKPNSEAPKSKVESVIEKKFPQMNNASYWTRGNDSGKTISYAEVEEDNDDDDDDYVPETAEDPQTSRKRRMSSKTSTDSEVKPEVDEEQEVEENQDTGPPKAKRGRKKKDPSEVKPKEPKPPKEAKPPKPKKEPPTNLEILTKVKEYVALNKDTAPNTPQLIHAACQKYKAHLKFEFTPAADGQLCEVFVNGIYICKRLERAKKAAKQGSMDAFLNVIEREYIKIEKVGSREELISSDHPFEDSHDDDDGIKKLGGLQVAARGMKRLHSDHSIGIARLEKMIILDHVGNISQNAISVLRQSADFNKIPLAYQFNEIPEGIRCRILVDGVFVAEGIDRAKQTAKLLASENLLSRLRERCWTLAIKKNEDTDASGFSRDEILGEIDKKSSAISSDNKGSQLLRKMGWTGSGLGRDGSGIKEPVSAGDAVINRQGFGMMSNAGISKDFTNKVRETLLDYCKSNSQEDIRFSPEFSKEERVIIHKQCERLNLRSTSRGSGDERYLIVSRKRNKEQLLNHVMNSGGSTSKYDLIAPGQKSE